MSFAFVFVVVVVAVVVVVIVVVVDDGGGMSLLFAVPNDVLPPLPSSSLLFPPLSR